MTGFEIVFKEYQDYIFKFLLKLTKDISLAEELTQETFLKAYMNFSNLKNKEKLPIWLCQIAKNTYFAWYNQQKKFSSLDLEQIQESTPDFEELLTDKELSKIALQALHSLDEPYKEVFMLSVFGQVSLKEISTIFVKSESWARVTFYRAKQKLIERMSLQNEM